MNLAKWMDDLDGVCQSDAEMRIHDLPFAVFQEAYQAGYTPHQFREREMPGAMLPFTYATQIAGSNSSRAQVA
jgi:hypothetical protein